MNTSQTSDPVREARFLQGATFPHVLKMTLASAIGLTAIFSVDLLNVFYINLLDNPIMTAALGFASTILLFQISIGIGLSVGASVFVSRQIGAGQVRKAKLSATTALFLALALSLLIVVSLMPFLGDLLIMIGARDEVIPLALDYLFYVFPAMPFLVFGMLSSGVMRGLGDAKGAMSITLSGAVLTAVLDPILILGLDMGFEGAAVAAVGSRIALFLFGAWHMIIRRKMVIIPKFKALINRGPGLAWLCLPIIMTNLATAVGLSLLTRFVAEFGTDANAANTSIGRLIPFMFGFLFSLSGAVGPVIGQNYGAGRFDRMRRAYIDAIIIVFCYTSVIIVISAVFAVPFTASLGLKDGVASLTVFFLNYCIWPYVFFGLLIVSNAVFNTLGKPHFATGFNWARATLGVVPFCYLGALYGGVEGVMLAHSTGFIPFGMVATFSAFYLMKQVTDKGRL